jgi:hypothetical protein
VTINQKETDFLLMVKKKNGEVRNAYRILVGKSQRKTTTFKIYVDVKRISKYAMKILFGNVVRIKLTQDKFDSDL